MFESYPFYDHRAIKFMQNCACFSNPCIIVLVPFSVTRVYHPKEFELHLLQCIAAYTNPTSASTVHLESSRNKDDTLSAKVLVHLFRQGLPLQWVRPPRLARSCIDRIGFQDVRCKPPSDNRSTVLHPFWHERPMLIGTCQLKLCRNQWFTLEPTNSCTKCTCANLYVGRKCSWYTVRCYKTVAARAVELEPGSGPKAILDGWNRRQKLLDGGAEVENLGSISTTIVCGAS